MLRDKDHKIPFQRERGNEKSIKKKTNKNAYAFKFLHWKIITNDLKILPQKTEFLIDVCSSLVQVKPIRILQLSLYSV